MFPGSIADRQLRRFCRRFRVRQAQNFHGFYAGQTGVLYRRANCVRIKTKSSVHERWVWKNLLGPAAKRKLFDYILLHGPAQDEARERFFAVKRRALERLVASRPQAAEKISVHANAEDPKGLSRWVFDRERAGALLRRLG